MVSQHHRFWYPLRHAAFCRLWVGLVVSRLGDQFTTIGLLWFVYSLTNSGTALGLIILCFRFPGIVTGPLLGRLLDRYQPRLVLGLDNLLRAVVIALIPLLYWSAALEMWHIYVLALIAGALMPATEVGVNTMMPELIPRPEFEQANTLLSLTWQVASLAGPAMAGFLVATFGGPWVLFIDAATFLLMGGVAVSLPGVQREPAAQRLTQPGRWFGFDTLLKLRYVRTTTTLTLIFYFAYGPMEAIVPVYSDTILQAGAAGYGALWSAMAVGSLAGLLSVGFLAAYPRPGVLLAWIAILWGLLLLPLVVITRLPLAMLFFALAGCVWTPYLVIETSLIQRLAPAHVRGEIFGVRTTLLSSALPLGAALGGLLLDSLSVPVVIGISASACVATGVVGLWSPGLRRIRHTQTQEAAYAETMM